MSHAPQAISPPQDAPQHVSPDLRQQAAGPPAGEVIDLVDDDGALDSIQSPSTPLLDDGYSPGQMAPVTPPEIAASSSPSQALIAGRLQARKIDENHFELFNYTSAYGSPLHGLSCWARLDYGITSPQSTSSLGPPLSSVKWRRTIEADSGKLLSEGPIIDDEQDQEGYHFESPLDCVTELWHSALVQPPAFRAHEDALEEVPEGWDGSHDNPLPAFCNFFYHNYVTYLAKSVDDHQSTLSSSDEEWEDMAKARHMTRQEKKAIEKEISWREILEQPPENVQAFVEATQKEAASFTEWRSLRPVPPKEAEKILSDPQTKKRIVSSRAVYRDKNKGIPPLRAKARVVARGNQDPDLVSLTRQAATPNRISEMLILNIFLSGLHGMAFNSGIIWHLWSGDATTAFLQGVQDFSERAGKIWMKAPRDPIIKLAGVFQSELYEITGNIYGLSNAPVTWAREVTSRLETFGFRIHSFDHMLFYFEDPLNPPSPCAILLCYVDDFLLTYNERFDFEKFVSTFTWGSKKHLTENDSITFKGKEIALLQDGNQKVLKITQKEFIESLDMGKVSTKRRKDEQLGPEDWPEFRSLSGCLQWLAGQCRLDIASTVSLSNAGADTTYGNLQDLYDALQFVKDTADEGIVLRPVPIDPSTVVVAYSDASWANAPGSASQHGQLLLLAPATVTEAVCFGTVVDWKSGRSKRVCRSTLAAESVAADTATDRIAYIVYALSELVFGIPAHKVGPRLKSLLVTDCKSLYDCVSSSNPSIEDKRSLVNVRSIQEFITAKTVHWVPTQYQMADCLTKISKDLRSKMLEWLSGSAIRLRSDQSKKNTPVRILQCLRRD